MRIPVKPLTALVREIFTADGCSPEEAGRIAHYLVGANLAGHDSHGVVRVARYVEWRRSGQVVADQTPEIVTENAVMAVVDGKYGFGQTVGPIAVRLGMDKAKANGVSLIALRHAGHLGRIGDWPEMAAAENLVSIHFVNVAGSQLVAPFGGTERRMSTNPVAIGVPRPGEPPVILDFATSTVAEGKVLVAYTGGKPLPPGALIEPDGRLSDRPSTLYGQDSGSAVPNPRGGRGAIRAFGEHKGSGLAFMCELLAGVLTGSGTSGPGEVRLCNGMLSIYLSLDFFESDDGFAGALREYVDFFKSARPAEPGGAVLIPGEPERATRAAREAEGIPLSDGAWTGILDAARRVGLTDAQVDACLDGWERAPR